MDSGLTPKGGVETTSLASDMQVWDTRAKTHGEVHEPSSPRMRGKLLRLITTYMPHHTRQSALQPGDC